MSGERKVKKTLGEKLGGKKIPKKIELKVDGVETKSSLFEEIKNKGKSNKSKTSAGSSLKVVQKPKTIKSQLENERSAVKRTIGKVKTNTHEESESKLEALTAKPLNVKKSPIKIKASLHDDPGDSKKMKKETSDEKWEPPNWELMLQNIRNMRTEEKAPVDTMGCHKCADEKADEKTQRFQKLVALMLSSQTKDETTYHAMLRLRENNLTPEAICAMKVSVLENILHPVSFYKNKAKYLQQTSKILIEKYNSDIPNNIKELVALPGVGPKMAHICMSTAWKEVTGIGVDVHVHRISNRIGWLKKPTKEPEQTRLALEAWLPQHLWSEVNYLLVGFGQTICTPVKPKCNECLNCAICPFGAKLFKKEMVQNSAIMDICDNVKFKKSKLHT